MSLAVRCYTCNKVIGHLEIAWREWQESGKPNAAFFEKWNIVRVCCRRHFLGYVDLMEELLKYPKKRYTNDTPVYVASELDKKSAPSSLASSSTTSSLASSSTTSSSTASSLASVRDNSTMKPGPSPKSGKHKIARKPSMSSVSSAVVRNGVSCYEKM